MRLKTVALIGAGAVGGYFVRGLNEADDVNLTVIASGERAARIREQGLDVLHHHYDLHVAAPDECSVPDLLLIAVKTMALESTFSIIEQVIGPDTIVMSLLNGVDSEEKIAARIGSERILWSLMKIASERKGNQVLFDPEIVPGVFMGGHQGGVNAETAAEVTNFFNAHHIHAHLVPDIEQEIWSKYAHNVSYNLPQAIVGTGIGAFSESEHGRALVEGLRLEVVRVAAAKGVDISEASKYVVQPGSAAKTAKYSTLQDLEAGRKTEVEAFAGEMVRMGDTFGIDVPYCRFCLHLIHMLEEKNEGRYDHMEGFV